MHETSSDILHQLGKADHEQVVFCQDKKSGLRAIIAIHNTQLGPALGGCRMFPYASEAQALTDVLRLSRGMTYKSSISGLNLGGGKAVIIADPKRDKTELLWRTFGRFVEGLNGRYITAEDAGVSVADIETVRQETRHVVGCSQAFGGSGDPSPVTALGVFHGMRAAIEEKLGRSDFQGLRIAVQGLGHVGRHLVGHLIRAGASVIAADLDAERVDSIRREFQVDIVSPEAVLQVPCDVFSPCAMGGILNSESISTLKAKVIAGAANNQFADESRDGTLLDARGILYAPDYVINAGGVINVAGEFEGYHAERALAQTRHIYEVLKDVFALARRDGVPTYQAANYLAQRRLEQIGQMRPHVTGREFALERPVRTVR